jgi:hypothetical protein
MSHHDYSEATSVLLRVFLELTTDHYIATHNLLPAKTGERRNASLAKKLKKTAKHLYDQGRISQDLYEATERSVSNDPYVQASVVTFHQYVHNRHKPAVASELETIWDVALEPLIVAVFS